MPKSRMPQSYRSTTSLPLSLIPLIYLTAGGLFLYSALALLPSSLFPFLLSILASRSAANLPTLYCSVCSSLYTLSTYNSKGGEGFWVILFYSILQDLLCVWNALTLIITLPTPLLPCVPHELLLLIL